MNYIIFWKDTQGQQVHTVVDVHDEPVRRDAEYVEKNGIVVLGTPGDVLVALENATGEKFAVTPEVARATLGWDI